MSRKRQKKKELQLKKFFPKLYDPMCSIFSGETLLLVGEVMGVKSRGVRPSRFLRCFDKNGENVYLPFELKGKFSAIAKEDNISGVHTPENLTSKRLPVMARLVHGLPPVGLKSSQTFLPEVRLFNAFEEDYLVAMTLGKQLFVYFCNLHTIFFFGFIKMANNINNSSF